MQQGHAMNLARIYKTLRPSVVAFVNNFAPIRERDDLPPLFPQIVGTGFVIDEDGLIVTNSHVAKAFAKVPKPDDLPGDQWPVHGILLHITEAGQIEIPLEIRGVLLGEGFRPGTAYYGSKEGPDIAVVHVHVRGLPALRLDCTTPIEEGLDIATAGFPMGTDALTAPGWLHQVTPTLQRGIVSAVLPFPCASPHAFSVDVMTQGGASGSPVVTCEGGGVIGVLYAGLHDVDLTLKNREPFKTPTSISYVVPSRHISHMLTKIKEDRLVPAAADAPTVEEILTNSSLRNALEYGREWGVWGCDTDEPSSASVDDAPLESPIDLTNSGQD